MLEFIFFHEIPTRLFAEWLKQQGVMYETQQKDDSYVVSMEEEMDDELYELIEDKYEVLFDMNEDIMKEEGDAGVHTANISVHLQDGRTSYALVDPKVLGRVIAAISAEELGDIVKAVVTAVECPQEKSSCQLQSEVNDQLNNE